MYYKIIQFEKIVGYYRMEKYYFSYVNKMGSKIKYYK